MNNFIHRKTVEVQCKLIAIQQQTTRKTSMTK